MVVRRLSRFVHIGEGLLHTGVQQTFTHATAGGDLGAH